jgi:hypothetical protein
MEALEEVRLVLRGARPNELFLRLLADMSKHRAHIDRG